MTLALALLLLAFPLQDARRPIAPGPTLEETAAVRAVVQLERGNPRWYVEEIGGVALELGVAGAVGSPRFRDEPVLARGRTDVDGRLETTVAVPVSWLEREDARLWVRVAEVGFQRDTAEVPLRREPKPIELVPFAGGTLFGTVRDAAGEPVSGARVLLVEEGELRSRRAPADESGRPGRVTTVSW